MGTVPRRGREFSRDLTDTLTNRYSQVCGPGFGTAGTSLLNEMIQDKVDSEPLPAEILPDCKAKKQERDRSDQIFFETVVEVAVRDYDLRQGTIHVRPTVSRARRRPTTHLRMDVPDLRTGLRPGGRFLVERNDPGDDHRADDEYVGSSSDLSNHCRAPVFFCEDSPPSPSGVAVVNFWLIALSR